MKWKNKFYKKALGQIPEFFSIRTFINHRQQYFASEEWIV